MAIFLQNSLDLTHSKFYQSVYNKSILCIQTGIVLGI